MGEALRLVENTLNEGVSMDQLASILKKNNFKPSNKVNIDYWKKTVKGGEIEVHIVDQAYIDVTAKKNKKKNKKALGSNYQFRFKDKNMLKSFEKYLKSEEYLSGLESKDLELESVSSEALQLVEQTLTEASKGKLLKDTLKLLKKTKNYEIHVDKKTGEFRATGGKGFEKNTVEVSIKKGDTSKVIVNLLGHSKADAEECDDAQAAVSAISFLL